MSQSAQDARLHALNEWANRQLRSSCILTPVSGDASFRRYFRYRDAKDEVSYIFVDAPPDKEASGPFLDVASQLSAAGVHVPEVLAVDEALGFMMLSDFGDTLLYHSLTSLSLASLEEGLNPYLPALDILATFQKMNVSSQLPLYDEELLEREISLFEDWFLRQHLALDLSRAEQGVIKVMKSALIESALAQPQVFVHRDYHSRNIMLTERGLGIIDFQDAVKGPWTYDVVSLLKDCYIVWPREQVDNWARAFFHHCYPAGVAGVSEQTWMRQFDWMGLQRHLKAIGIFSRLNRRDGKPGYLNDIPRTLRYVIDVCKQYDALRDFGAFIEQRVVPNVLPAVMPNVEPGEEGA